MILSDELEEILFDDVTFPLSHTINPTLFDLVSCAEKTSPASDGVGPDDWMGCLEVKTTVLGCTTIA